MRSGTRTASNRASSEPAVTATPLSTRASTAADARERGCSARRASTRSDLRVTAEPTEHAAKPASDRERDRRRLHAEADPEPEVPPLGSRLCLALPEAVVVDHRRGQLERLGRSDLVLDHPRRQGVREILLSQDVAPAQFQRIHADLARDHIHHLLGADGLHQERAAVRGRPVLLVYTAALRKPMCGTTYAGHFSGRPVEESGKPVRSARRGRWALQTPIRCASASRWAKASPRNTSEDRARL
jgi:hypothetical protein